MPFSAPPPLGRVMEGIVIALDFEGFSSDNEVAGELRF